MTGSGQPPEPPADVTLGLRATERLLAVLGFAVLGGVIGFFLPWLLEMAARLPWAPFQGPLRFVEALGEALPVGTAVVGAAVGAALTLAGTHGSALLTVRRDELVLTADGEQRVVQRSRIARIHKDGDDLVLLDAGEREVDRAAVDASEADLADAFEQHGYPWSGADPTG